MSGYSICIFKRYHSLETVAEEDTRGHLYTVNKPVTDSTEKNDTKIQLWDGESLFSA